MIRKGQIRWMSNMFTINKLAYRTTSKNISKRFKSFHKIRTAGEPSEHILR